MYVRGCDEISLLLFFAIMAIASPVSLCEAGVNLACGDPLYPLSPYVPPYLYCSQKTAVSFCGLARETAACRRGTYGLP
jgi:hypothetical protein